MNNRDPILGIRRTPSSPLASIQTGLRTGANFVASSANDFQHQVQQITQSSQTVEEGLDVSMSQPVSRHAHSHSNDMQDSRWQPRKTHDRSANGVGEKVQDYFKSKDELPMYKDKPYNYSPSQRLPLWRRYRSYLLATGSFLLFLFYFGAFSRSSPLIKGVSKLGSDTAKWESRQMEVRKAFQLSWKAYERNAWGFDKYLPVSKSGEQMIENGMGWIIVDALDTMILMNLTSELTNARNWVSSTLSYDQDHDVNTFETTIRMLGGLLSAHYLQTSFPNMAPLSDDADEDLYLEKASDLAERLMGAYDSNSGVPFASINLAKREGIRSHDDGGASSTAEAASVQLEMKYLANLTGEPGYWSTAEKVIKIIDDNGMKDGLLPIFIYADTGTFRGNNIRLGSRGDSYYEYLIKQYLQTSKQEPIYQDLWEEALTGIKKHLITYSKHASLTILGERPNGLEEPISAKMDHLVCFMPGTIALAATGGLPLNQAKKSPSWGKKQEEDVELARQLMKTCWGMYKKTATGLAPEISYFIVDEPAAMMADGIRQSPETLSDDPEADWRKDFDIHANDLHNLQRPETVESLFYMWRITGDEIYREWGWQMFQSFMKYTFVDEESGFTSVANVDVVPAPARDNMESFWLAETLKYFYLLFGPDDVLPLDQVVFNTEAHPFPNFELGRFKTGWTRKPRDAEGKIVKTEETKEAPAQQTQVVYVTPTKEGPS